MKESLNAWTIIKVWNWKIDDIGTSKSKVYIKKFKCSPVTCEISFYSTLSDDDSVDRQEGRSVLQFIKRFGLSFSTIEKAPIWLNALEIDNLKGTMDDITSTLKESYIIWAK